mgnify:FL=1
MKNDNLIVKKNENKKSGMSNFLSFICEPKVVGTFLVGLVFGLVIMRLCFPQRIAKLADGTEVVVSYDDKQITADTLYEDMKEFFSVNVLLNDVDMGILDAKYGKTDERAESAEYYTKYYIDMYKDYYGYNEEDAIKALGFETRDEVYEYFELDYLRHKYYDEYLEKQITEDTIKKYYKNNVYGDYNTKHMLVKVASDATSKEKKTAKKLAEEIIKKLKSGKSWDEVATEYKDKITVEDLGVKTFKDSIDSAYVKEALALKVNTYSKKPVLGTYGYHIIYKVAQEDKKPLEEIRSDVIELVKKDMEAKDSKLFYKVLVNLRNEANLKIYDTRLNDAYKHLVASYK